MATVVEARAAKIKARMKRHKLVFLQLGTMFDCIRSDLVAAVGGSQIDAAAFCSQPDDHPGPVVLLDVERFAATGRAGNVTLGALRKRVDEQLETSNVCLVSRAPRMAYAPVSGSSLIEDAAPCMVDLLSDLEAEAGSSQVGRVFPPIGLGDGAAIEDIFRAGLKELGMELLATLDYALFEAGSREDFVQYLEPRALEGLRGAGHLRAHDDEVGFAEGRRITEYVQAVTDVLAGVTDPPEGLAAVSDGLWRIERTIRRQLRQAAMERHSGRWRRQILHGDLAEKVLTRARMEAYVTASSVAKLRDPIEWLSLGELLEVVRSEQMSGLGQDAIFWQRFAQDVLPVRNRYSHMRLLKRGDVDIVRMWVSRVREEFPDSAP